MAKALEQNMEADEGVDDDDVDSEVDDCPIFTPELAQLKAKE